MIDRSVRQRLFLFLAVVACLSMSLQNTGHYSSPLETTGALRCVEASLVGASTLPKDGAGEGPFSEDCSPAQSFFLVSARPGTALLQQGRLLLPAGRRPAEGFPAEIYRPPITAL